MRNLFHLCVLMSIGQAQAITVATARVPDGYVKLAVKALPACNARDHEDRSRWLALPVIGAERRNDLLVSQGGRVASLAEIGVRSGLVMWDNDRLDALTFAAMAEGRGYWRCAGPSTLFKVAGVRSDPNLLAAIAIKESGIGPRQFWPWTINYAGRSYRYATEAEAIQVAQSLIDRGIKSVDLGLMQINWMYHGHRFGKVAMAFAPEQAARVADDILTEHYRRTGDWVRAVQLYHSGDPSRSVPYANQVLATFRQIANHRG